MRVAVAGSGGFTAGALQALLDSEHEVCALVRNGRLDRGVLGRLGASVAWCLGARDETYEIAQARGLPIVPIDTMKPEELAPLAAAGPDLLFVAGFSIILKRAILDLPRVGCLNAHSSLLPKHRGPNPFGAVVLAGEKESGVTFHMMTEGIDDGPIVAQFPFPVCDHDTATSVFGRRPGSFRPASSR